LRPGKPTGASHAFFANSGTVGRTISVRTTGLSVFVKQPPALKAKATIISAGKGRILFLQFVKVCSGASFGVCGQAFGCRGAYCCVGSGAFYGGVRYGDLLAPMCVASGDCRLHGSGSAILNNSHAAPEAETG
jgi:hypothetical protein